MTLEEYLASTEFMRFQDETLRKEAIRAAEEIHGVAQNVKRHQLHGIQGVIQGAGLGGLIELAGKQKEKNSNKMNKAFWQAIDDLLSKSPTADRSFFRFMKDVLLEKGCIENEEGIEEKKEQKQLRKRNNRLVEMAMEAVIGVYFEHFTCHYFYKTQEGGKR